MSIRYETRSITHSVPRCPHCKGSHDYSIVIRSTSEAPTILFGGRDAIAKDAPRVESVSPQTDDRWTVKLTCPVTQRNFQTEIPLRLKEGQRIVSVEATEPGLTDSTSIENVANSPEFEEWTKSSSGNARDFCKVMIATSIGAIPIHFVALKYLGSDTANSKLMQGLGITVPMFFLVSAVYFILALRPQYAKLTSNEFDTFRTRRLKTMNQLISVGTVIFLLGLAIAIVTLGYTTGLVGDLGR